MAVPVWLTEAGVLTRPVSLLDLEPGATITVEVTTFPFVAVSVESEANETFVIEKVALERVPEAEELDASVTEDSWLLEHKLVVVSEVGAGVETTTADVPESAELGAEETEGVDTAVTAFELAGPGTGKLDLLVD